MAFQSLHEVAKKSRRAGGRSGAKPRALVTVTQAYYKDKDITALTFRLSKEAMDKARFHKGDRADVAYDSENNLWRIGAVQGKTNGYAVSSNENTGVGQVRLTYYPEMPSIADPKTKKAKGYSDDSKVDFALGEVIFSVENIEIDEGEGEIKDETKNEGGNEDKGTVSFL